MILGCMQTLMKRPSIWLAIGIAAGAAINDSSVALVVGVVIALAPFVLVGMVDVASRFYRWMWQEVDWANRLVDKLRQPAQMTAAEYDRFYSRGELPERFEKKEKRG
jgi:hypothetical protein